MADTARQSPSAAPSRIDRPRVVGATAASDGRGPPPVHGLFERLNSTDWTGTEAVAAPAARLPGAVRIAILLIVPSVAWLAVLSLVRAIV